MNRLPTLTGICTGCGSPDGLYQPQSETIYCPNCARLDDEYSLARMQLGSLIGPIVTAWYRHWRARGVTSDSLVEMTENSNEVADIVAALKGYETPKPEAAVPHSTLLQAA